MGKEKTIIRPSEGCSKAFIFEEEDQAKQVLLKGANSLFAKEDLYRKERNGDEKGIVVSLTKISKELMDRGYPFSENDLECQWYTYKYRNLYNIDSTIAHQALEPNVGPYMKLNGWEYRIDHQEIEKVKHGIIGHYRKKRDEHYDLYQDHDKYFSYLCRNFFVAALTANSRPLPLTPDYWRTKYRIEKREYKYELVCRKSPEYKMQGNPIFDVFHQLNEFINNMKLKYTKMQVSRSLYVHAAKMDIFQIPRDPLDDVPASEALIFEAIQAQLIMEHYHIDTELMKSVWHNRRGVICDNFCPDNSAGGGADYQAAILMTYCRKVSTLSMKNYESLYTVSIPKANKQKSEYKVSYDELAMNKNSDAYKTFWMVLMQAVYVHDLTLQENMDESLQQVHRSIVKYGYTNIPMKVWTQHWETTSTHYIIERECPLHPELMEQIFPADPFAYEEEKARVKVCMPHTWDHTFLSVFIMCAKQAKLSLVLRELVDAAKTFSFVDMRSMLYANDYKMELKPLNQTWKHLLRFYHHMHPTLPPPSYEQLRELVLLTPSWSDKAAKKGGIKPIADPLYWTNQLDACKITADHSGKENEDGKKKVAMTSSPEVVVPDMEVDRPEAEKLRSKASNDRGKENEDGKKKVATTSSTEVIVPDMEVDRPEAEKPRSKASNDRGKEKEDAKKKVVTTSSTEVVVPDMEVDRPEAEKLRSEASNEFVVSADVKMLAAVKEEHANEADVEMPAAVNGEHANEVPVVVEVVNTVNGEHSNTNGVLNTTIPVLPPDSLPATKPDFNPYKDTDTKFNWEDESFGLWK